MELIDYSPMFGRWTFAGDDRQTGETVIVEKFDKGHALKTVDRTKLMASEGLGRGENLRLHCSIPPFVQVEMLEKWGVDCKSRDHLPKVFELIRTEYPHLIVNKA